MRSSTSGCSRRRGYTVRAAAGPLRADALAARLPPWAWQKLAAGTGVKGRRWYGWAWAGIDRPARAPLAALVRVAGLRWTVGRVQGPGRKKGIGASDPGMTGYTLPEIRRLLISLVPGLRTRPRGRLVPGPAGAGDASTRPGYAATGTAATHSRKGARRSWSSGPGQTALYSVRIRANDN